MQENIRSYKRLEQEANVLQEKIAQLEQIMTEHSSFLRAKQDEPLYAYLIDCAQQDIKVSELEEMQKRMDEQLVELQDIEISIAALNSRLSQMRDESNQLHARLINDETEQAIKQLQSEIDAKEA